MIYPFETASPPEWASGYGQDEFGYYVEFSIRTGLNYLEFVTQRMRWIPPGRFLMGSPETEHDHESREGPQHEVVLKKGFWLADTACPQALWSAVMPDNPSRFSQSVDRPVESVSYDDVTKFMARLSDLIHGINVTLPTEAQWEYACRAGTTSPFSFGDNVSTDMVNYDGNFPYAGAAKGEYRSETVEVKALPPNPWGLHQMHGNVWEWCRDWYGPYSPGLQVDPTGPEQGSDRVVRGGSWVNYARNVRSACRDGDGPGNRLNALGFRLLSLAEPEQAQDTSSTPSQ